MSFLENSWTCPNMHMMNTSGREGDATSIHCVSALVQNVRTQSRYTVMKDCTTPDVNCRVPSTHWPIECYERAKWLVIVFSNRVIRIPQKRIKTCVLVRSDKVQVKGCLPGKTALPAFHYVGLYQATWRTYMISAVQIPELYKQMKLPVCDGVQGLLEINIQRNKLWKGQN